jgi:hypothetical protein
VKKAVLRAFRLTLSPAREWSIISREPSKPLAALLSFAVPMTAIPALSWTLGLILFPEAPYAGILPAANRGALVYVSLLASIVLLAAAIHLLAPMFSVERSWSRSVQVAAYSGAPVFLSGFLLVVPDLAFILLLAIFHGFFLQYSGVRHVMGVKEDQAAEYVALCIVLMGVASTVLGAVASAIGVA